MTELKKIDLFIKLNWWLIEDGPHEAVDYQSVKDYIDRLLDERNEIIKSVNVACS